MIYSAQVASEKFVCWLSVVQHLCKYCTVYVYVRYTIVFVCVPIGFNTKGTIPDLKKGKKIELQYSTLEAPIHSIYCSVTWKFKIVP
jgi:hypothetical protein